MKEMQEFEQVDRFEGNHYVYASDYDALLAYTKGLAKDLSAMTVDRDLWQGEHNEDCPNLAAARASEGGWIDCKKEEVEREPESVKWAIEEIRKIRPEAVAWNLNNAGGDTWVIRGFGMGGAIIVCACLV